MHHLKSADLYLSVSHLLYFQNLWQLHLQWRKNCSRPVYLDLKILTKWSKFSESSTTVSLITISCFWDINPQILYHFVSKLSLTTFHETPLTCDFFVQMG